MTRNLVPQNGHVTQHFDLCRVRYTPGKESDDGVPPYLKPALKADDPGDLLEYARVNQSFSARFHRRPVVRRRALRELSQPRLFRCTRGREAIAP